MNRDSNTLVPMSSDGPAAIQYEHVGFAYPRQGGSVNGAPREAIKDITLEVNPGERLGILGPNGGGKSTLLKLTLGLLRGQGGSIRVFGLSPEDARRRRLIGYVPQKIEAELAFPLSVRQVVRMSTAAGLAPWKFLSADQRAAADHASISRRSRRGLAPMWRG